MIIPVVAIDLADRRRLPDAGGRVLINLLTLLAIVLAVRLVVDDAIVMVENVERHLHAGMAPIEALTAAASWSGRSSR